MFDKEKQEEIFNNAELYKKYFADDEKALDDLLNKLSDLQNIANDQIKTMVNAAPGRGVQHNLIEHMSNAIALSSEFQSVLKDKRSIKERSLDLAIKNSKTEESVTDMSDIISNMQKLIKETNQKRLDKVEKLEEKVLNNEPTEEELDKEIEKKLGL